MSDEEYDPPDFKMLEMMADGLASGGPEARYVYSRPDYCVGIGESVEPTVRYAHEILAEEARKAMAEVRLLRKELHDALERARFEMDSGTHGAFRRQYERARIRRRERLDDE